MLEHVPSSRSDVFSTKHISPVEKRIFMKFVSFCLEYQEYPEKYENYLNRTFLDFLKHEKLTDNLIHFVVHTIAMVEPNINTLEGLKATQKFLSSLGRFGGNTPFLYPSFGSGELPQVIPIPKCKKKSTWSCWKARAHCIICWQSKYSWL